MNIHDLKNNEAHEEGTGPVTSPNKVKLENRRKLLESKIFNNFYNNLQSSFNSINFQDWFEYKVMDLVCPKVLSSNKLRSIKLTRN